jgi:hypothetical protein
MSEVTKDRGSLITSTVFYLATWAARFVFCAFAARALFDEPSPIHVAFLAALHYEWFVAMSARVAAALGRAPNPITTEISSWVMVGILALGSLLVRGCL